MVICFFEGRFEPEIQSFLLGFLESFFECFFVKELLNLSNEFIEVFLGLNVPRPVNKGLQHGYFFLFEQILLVSLLLHVHPFVELLLFL